MIIYFDENIPEHLVKGFAQLQEYEGLKIGIEAELCYIPRHFYKGVKDTDWIPKLRDQKSFVITQDIHITRRKQELELYRQHQVGLFLMRGTSKKQGMSVWEMVEALAKHWNFILKTCKAQNTPFAYEVKLKGKPKKIE